MAELYITLAAVFQRFDMRLFKTRREDVTLCRSVAFLYFQFHYSLFLLFSQAFFSFLLKEGISQAFFSFSSERERGKLKGDNGV